MKVKELIEKLETFDPEVEVLCSTEDEAIIATGELFRLFHIQGISLGRGTPGRNDNGAPTITLDNGRDTSSFVFIDVTTTF